MITSGNTVREAATSPRSDGAVPAGICALFDKRGIKEVDGVPVHALVRISMIEREAR